MLAESRRAAIVDLLRSTGSVTVGELEERFGISSMTARRDLADLERQGLPAARTAARCSPRSRPTRTPSWPGSRPAPEAKQALARAAVATLAPRQSVFLDSSSTAYFVAQRILEEGLQLTIITNSLPVMELVGTSASPNVELIGVGGSLRRLTRSFVGPFAVHTVLGHFADRLLPVGQGRDRDGALTDADPLEAEVKATMIAHAEEAFLLIDHSKLRRAG